MVRAVVSEKGKTEFAFVNENLNAQAHTAMLVDRLLPFIEDKHGTEDDEDDEAFLNKMML